MLIEITILLSKERVSDKSYFKIKYILRKCRATPMNISCGPRVTSSLQSATELARVTQLYKYFLSLPTLPCV